MTNLPTALGNYFNDEDRSTDFYVVFFENKKYNQSGLFSGGQFSFAPSHFKTEAAAQKAFIKYQQDLEEEFNSCPAHYTNPDYVHAVIENPKVTIVKVHKDFKVDYMFSEC